MSTLKVDTLQTTGGAGLYPAQSWVNFNGTGTVAIRADGDVSSITDVGTGSYGINFSNSLTDANYSPNVTGQGHSSGAHCIAHLFQSTATNSVNPTSSGYNFIGLNWNNGTYDYGYLCCSTTR